MIASLTAAGLATPPLASAEIEYTVALALFDAVPVILSVIAYMAMSTLPDQVGARRLVTAGAIAAGLGGGTKVAWKITIAASDVDVTWLDDLLFPCLAVGLLLIAMGLRGIDLQRATQVVVGTLAASAATLLATTPDVASIVLLSAMTVASIMITLHLVTESRRRQMLLPAVFASINLAVVFVLVAFARLDQTVAMQWIEETINACSQACLLAAAFMLRAKVLDRSHPRSSVSEALDAAKA